MKWNANNIVEFLNVYQKFPILWNIKSEDYRKSTKLKDEVFQHLFNELKEKELIGRMDTRQLKAKIKSIKDVIRQELNKIEKSEKSGCSTEDVYTPKLAWFNEANYLGEVLASRNRTSNLDVASNTHDTVPDEVNESYIESVISDNENYKEEILKKKTSPGKMKPPSNPIKKGTKRAAQETSLSGAQAINQLDKIAQNAAEERPYDQFGKFVASELRQLQPRQAILLQQEIQNAIIRSKLSSFDHTYAISQKINCTVSPSSSVHQSLADCSSNNDDDDDDDDALKQMMLNKFGPRESGAIPHTGVIPHTLFPWFVVELASTK